MSTTRSFRFGTPYFRQFAPTISRKWHIHNEQDMLRRFKRDLGYFTNTLNEYGEHEIEYLSISFAAMEQHEFERFYNQCIDLVLNKYIKGIDKDDLITEIEEFK